MPDQITVVCIVPPDGTPQEHILSLHTIRGWTDATDRQNYVDGLELAPEGTLVRFEHHSLYSDFGQMESAFDLFC